MKTALRAGLGALFLFFAANVAVAASDDPAEPSPEDHQAVQECLEASRGAETLKIAADCIGVVANPCLDVPDNQTTYGMASCLQREERIWDSLLNDWYGSARQYLSAELKRQFRDVQRAWIAWRDAKCGFEHAKYEGGTLGTVTGASCMLETTGARALELRSLVVEYESR
ncbi:lysozyme inhibitor LprI family protein [Rhodobium gokarnense]|uniref:Uncharacterized protein YecT (DUF1311 family) n=1 Tax=Rhodobium gokarnense TaxID=364296 RepID=A0ABT3HA05_9HYPH|nr:lysozyme inhibitor LprI family protein [Rhodobium gokarnense]MCW2307223.1 uncharacterized protein YecT (DUF1311 family) [Rhodobium gokarnense]